MGLVQLNRCQLRSFEQILVNSDRAVDLTSLTQDTAQCNVRIERVFVHRQRLSEGVHRIILFAVEQKIKAPVILRGELCSVCTVHAQSTATQRPACGNREHEQHQKQCVIENQARFLSQPQPAGDPAAFAVGGSLQNA